MPKVEIECTENGPNLIIVDGNVIAAMYRCDASNTKPYCDGTHAKAGFKADAEEGAYKVKSFYLWLLYSRKLLLHELWNKAQPDIMPSLRVEAEKGRILNN